MASVENRESQSSFSDTLDFFAAFKTIDEDKDSDEESFHLPLLDCDDEVQGKELQNGETEEEILNKFEGSDTPDIVDPKIEDSILDDDDDIHATPKNNDNENVCRAKDEVLSNDSRSSNNEKSLTVEDKSSENKNRLNSNEENETEKDDIHLCPNELNLENPDKNCFQSENNSNISQSHEPEESYNEKLGKETDGSEQLTEESSDDQCLETSSEEPFCLEMKEDNADSMTNIDSMDTDKINLCINNSTSDNFDETAMETDNEPTKLDNAISTSQNMETETASESKIIECDIKDDAENLKDELVNEEDKMEIEEDDDTGIEIGEENKSQDESCNKDSISLTDELTLKEKNAETNEISKTLTNDTANTDYVNQNDIKNSDETIETNSLNDQKLAEETELSKVMPGEKLDKIQDSEVDSIKDMPEEKSNEILDSVVETVKDLSQEKSDKIQEISEEIQEKSEEIQEKSEEIQEKSEEIAEKSDEKQESEVALVKDTPEEILDEIQDSRDESVEDVPQQKSDDIENSEDNVVKDILEDKSSEICDSGVESEKLDEIQQNSKAESSIDSLEEKSDEMQLDSGIESDKNMLEDKSNEVQNLELDLLKNTSEEKSIQIEQDSKMTDEENATNEYITETSTSAESEELNLKSNSNKEDHLDCDDLLDISVIRDVDEDNANAVAEVNENQGSDKSDNDDQDDDKADNDIEESEADQEDNLMSSDKDDPMDYEDGTSSNMCIEDSSTNENTSDSVNKVSNIDDKIDSEGSKSVFNEYNNSNQKPENDNLVTEPAEEEPAVYLDLDKHMAEQAALKEQNSHLHGKRSLSHDDNQSDVSIKKPKLSDSFNNVDVKTDVKDEVKTLLTFERFMQSKTFRTKLTRSDLEQFCLQKICEVIMHRTEVGELHQTIKKQEHLIDSLRKDLQQLTKQARDLDIVHRKLMSELKVQNGNKKPLVPLKITRSVGLQVKLTAAAEQNSKKKPTSTATPNRSTPTTPVNRTRNITPNNSNVVRQVNTSPRKQASPAVSQASSTSTPILNQVLQAPARTTPTTTTSRPIKPKQTESPKPAGQGSAGVIDLTDEDDKSSKSNVSAPVKILNKTLPLIGQPKLGTNVQLKTANKINKANMTNKTLNGPGKVGTTPGKVGTTPGKVGTTPGKVGTTPGKTVQTPAKASPNRTVTTLPQGVRLTPTQVKNGIAIPASVVTSNSAGGTQLMYVVQPSQLVTTTAGGQQKTVLLNFQPGNGILTSTLNGSAVSVIPTKTTNAVQLKTVTTPVRKHPAPLPSPPFIPTNSLLKPVLPKPHLSIRKTDTGIILQWRMPYNLDNFEAIASYQLYAYQETNAPPSTDMWRKVGDVKALALPMACTLTQFADKNKYYFAVRSIDVHKRIGAFSDPEEISL